MIRLGALEDDHYEYLEDLLALEGTRSKRRIRIGDSLEIEIQGANPSARQIDFVPTEKFYEAPTPKGQKVSQASKTGVARAKVKSARVVGPPEHEKGYKKPVKVTARKIYFGAWTEEPKEAAPSEGTKPKPKKRRKKR